MNERYLFKGKRKDNGEWVYGGIYYQKADEVKEEAVYIIGGSLNDVGAAYEVIPETVGQCTGLKDKIGKLIFEGDILHIKTGKGWSCPIGTDIYYKVVFTEFNIQHYGHTEYIGFMAERSDNYLSSIYYVVTTDRAEVIGNIHDNPELLEVEE